MHVTEDDCPPIRPLVALRALRGIQKNPEDTQQVFILTEALRGRSGMRLVQRFEEHPTGRKILKQRRSLLSILQNRTALERLPEGTLGRAYADFMRTEQLSAQALVDSAKNSGLYKPGNTSDRAFLGGRLRDMHDLFHVLTGYGRDELGEMCVLAFCYPQQGTRSFAVLSFFGTLKLRRTLGMPEVSRATRQAYQHGKYAAWIPGEPIEDMLGESLEGLRARWRILPPTEYRAIVAKTQASRSWIGQTEQAF